MFLFCFVFLLCSFQNLCPLYMISTLKSVGNVIYFSWMTLVWLLSVTFTSADMCSQEDCSVSGVINFVLEGLCLSICTNKAQLYLFGGFFPTRFLAHMYFKWNTNLSLLLLIALLCFVLFCSQLMLRMLDEPYRLYCSGDKKYNRF